MRRARHAAGGRRRSRGAGPDAVHQRGRARALGQQHARVLVPGARSRGRGPRLLPGHAVEEAVQTGARRGALRLRRGDLRPIQEPLRTPALVLHHLRRSAPQPGAAVQGDRLRRLPGETRAVHARDPVPRVQGCAAPARDPRGHRGQPAHLPADRPFDPEDARLPERARPVRAGGDDRGAVAEGDPRATGVPRGRRPRLPDALTTGRDPRRGRGAADPAGDTDRLGTRGSAVHPRRAVDRPASAGQSATPRHVDPPPRSRQYAHRRRARRGDDHRSGPHRRHRSAGGGARRSHRVLGRSQGSPRLRRSRSRGRTSPGDDPSLPRLRGASPTGGSASRACASTT